MTHPRILALVLAFAGVPSAAAAAAADGQHAHAEHPDHAHATAAAPAPLRQPGQAAFGALQEIVARLDADPATDWSRVDLERLRAHLLDMDAVLLHARVARVDLADGARYTVTGDGEVAAAIRRMLTGHAATLAGADGWMFEATPHAGGAVLTITAANPGEVARIRALGLFGALALGDHHQAHHWQMATGAAPHH